MPYDIILGRDKSDKKKFGSRGLIYLGKGYVTMGQHTSLSNNLFMDVARSHVVLIAGKRGSGKSYTIGVMAEELAGLPSEESRNIASIIFDTMGIFWTMKFENDKDSLLLKSWNLKPRKLPVKVLAPLGKVEEYRKKGIPIDSPFALKPDELDAEDWILTFNLSVTSPPGTLIQNIISKLKDSGEDFDIEEIRREAEKDKESSRETKNTVLALFNAASTWGIFASGNQEAVSISDLITPGSTTVIDLSVYSSVGSFNVRGLVIGLVSRKLFKERIDARKKEEIQSIQHGLEYMSYNPAREVPLIWIFIDEAHEFLPKTGKTPATDSLVQILREGRQPGISMVLATQQPGQIHRDVMTQSDIILSHRVTSQPDIESLNQIMQTYLLESIKQKLDGLPRIKGSAIILDDNSERIYPMRIRPRFTWHGGEAPTAVKAEIEF
ncbi:ATP-binding protein [Candidatus Pacearchaeota archaeon]|nr:ATP-binding protein [Candidatus Pacearchaeota archaeon]OIO43503.1 MAG: hypothetical protein AUJ64_02345 [Candidatus Pacearchaeota archaeon CG1_02_39_14]